MLHQYHVYLQVYLSIGQPMGVVVDSHSITHTHRSIPMLRPMGVLQVRDISQVQMWVGHLTLMG